MAKILSHIQAANMASSLIYSLADESFITVNYKKLRSIYLLRDQFSKAQIYSLIAIISDLNFDWMWSWQISIMRCKLCDEAHKIQTVKLSTQDALNLAFDLLYFKCGKYRYEFASLLTAIRGIQECSDIFAEAGKLWKKIIVEILNDPNNVNSTCFEYFGAIEYDSLPPREPITYLTLEEKEYVEEKIKLNLKDIIYP